MPPVLDEALCIRQWDWSETSQTAMLFSRAHGLLRVLAKGSRRPKSPYSGGIDVLTRANIGVIIRPHSELALLTEWDLAETYPALRSNLTVHNAGLFVADLLNQAVTDHDPHPALYDAAVESLRLMRSPPDVHPALLAFLWTLLTDTGYTPVLDRDVRSTGADDTLVPAPSYRFAPDLGGLTVDLSTPDTTHSDSSARSWRVRAATIDLLRALEADGLQGVAAIHPDARGVERATRLLAAYLRHILGHEPATMHLIFGRQLPR
jgi:DNA repair protein RecO (recombination protein O)